MPIDFDNLAGHVAQVLLDVRTVEDPWGLGISADVLRSDHPDWKKYTLDLAASSPTAEKVRRVTAEAAFSDMAPGGFRRTKKLTKTEAHQKMIRSLSTKEEVTTDIEDLREKKPGIAKILIRRITIQGETMIRVGGQEWDLTTEDGRIALLNHTNYEFVQDGSTKTRAIPIYKAENGVTVLDGEGEPVENQLGGWNTGDAIAKFLLDEASEAALYSEKKAANDQDRSGAISDGSTETGSVESLPSAE